MSGEGLGSVCGGLRGTVTQVSVDELLADMVVVNRKRNSFVFDIAIFGTT